MARAPAALLEVEASGKMNTGPYKPDTTFSILWSFCHQEPIKMLV